MHCGHWKGFSSVCRCWWRCSCLCWRKLLPHWAQGKGGSLACSCVCSASAHCMARPSPHFRLWEGFSSLCPGRICSCWAHSLHGGHWHGFFLMWVPICLRKHRFRRKRCPHSRHWKRPWVPCSGCASARLLNFCHALSLGDRSLEWHFWCLTKWFFSQKLSPQAGQGCWVLFQEGASPKPGSTRAL